jgi:hypothetical protein
MVFWRRRRESGSGSAADPAAPGERTLETHLDEGVLIAETALRLAAKNRLIVHALRDQEAFDDQWFAGALAEDIDALIAERESDADRLDSVRTSARRRLGRPRHFHDYRHADVGPLALRARVDRELAGRLRELRDDEAFTERILSAARESALDDIVSAHASRQLDLSAFVRDDRYIAERPERVASVLRDLEALQRARSW